MTDRELLELAAKATGYGDWLYFEVGFDKNPPHPYLRFRDIEGRWNPLVNDRDALRLAVKLKITVECLENATEVIFDDGDNIRRFNVGSNEGPCNGDSYAATRRAIVRAAAEIGRNMK